MVMVKPTLYLFIGYPGAGKTAVAKVIAETTGAVHLWADVERHRLFKRPTHSEAESVELYSRLNRQAGELLASGKNVIFDTNFNFFADRQKLRGIAERHGAKTVLIWITVPKQVAKKRAVHTPAARNGYLVSMTQAEFEAITAKLEPPTENENVVKIDGTRLDKQTVIKLLNL